MKKQGLRSEALRAAEVCEKLGAAKGMEDCRKFLRWDRGRVNSPVASAQPLVVSVYKCMCISQISRGVLVVCFEDIEIATNSLP
jgi:hypothetical protein